MKNLSLLIIVFALFTSCQNSKPENKVLNTWANAQWIAYEQLADSMKVVPAVHGSGNQLGDKCI